MINISDLFEEQGDEGSPVLDAISKTICQLCAVDPGADRTSEEIDDLLVEHAEVVVSVLREFATVATFLKLRVLQGMQNPEMLRAEFQHLLTELLPSSPEYHVAAFGGMDLSFEELPQAAKNAQRSAVASQLKKDPFSPDVENILQQLRMAQTFETISEIKDDAHRATIASVILKLMVQRLGPLTNPVQADDAAPRSGIIIPGQFSKQ